MKRNAIVVGLLSCALSLSVYAKDRQVVDADIPAVSKVAKQRAALKLPAAPVTDDQVGDADSFGRNVKWLGVANTPNINFQADCTPDPDAPPAPDDRCILLPAAPAMLSFNERDLDKITLPPKSAHSLICQSITPYLIYWYANPTATQQTGAFNFTPYWTVENEVLNDPAAVDPTTGIPYGGKLEYSLSATEAENRQLAPGETAFQRVNFTRQCIGGILTKDLLMESYGLSEELATKFFKKQTVMTFHVRGSMRMVENALILYGIRLLGD